MSKVYRSLLFVPAIEKYLSKISNLSADAFIIDLEDSILDSKKDIAIAETKKILKANNLNKDVFIRINKENFEEEIQQLSNYNFCGYMIPKVEEVALLNRVDTLVSKNKKIIALIESPKGIVNLDEILSKNIVSYLAFGAEDYQSFFNFEFDDRAMLYPRSKLVTYAYAYNLQVFDTVSLNYKDLTKLFKEVEESRKMGFTGKLAIHPSQIEMINQTFQVQNLEFYKYVLNEYNRSKNAVIEINGRLYERPHIKKIKKFLFNYGKGQDK